MNLVGLKRRDGGGGVGQCKFQSRRGQGERGELLAGLLVRVVRVDAALARVCWSTGGPDAFLVLAVFGSATMWMAVFADMGASLIVVFNGLRLLRGSGRRVQRALSSRAHAA